MRLLLISITTAALLGLPPAAQGRNIFDDDWKPPKESKPQPVTRPVTGLMLPEPKPAVPVTIPKPVNPVAVPSPLPTPVPVAPTVRHAVPNSVQQAAVRRTMKEVYTRELADRTPAGRRRLTQALIDMADKSVGQAAEEFVLLAAAGDGAIEVADLSLAFAAAERMGKHFVVDELGIKTEAVLAIGQKGTQGGLAAENVRLVMELGTELARADDFAMAQRVCQAMLSPALTPDLRTQLTSKQREFSAWRDAAARMTKDLETLRMSPDDPAANLAVGRYFCFVKSDWQNGLRMLAKGTDPLMKVLAAKEMESPKGADAISALADGWWEVAVKQTEVTAKSALQGHASALYSQVVSQTIGLRRQQIEKRIAEANTATNSTKFTDLLAQMDGTLRKVENNITMLARAGRLTSKESFKPPIAFKVVAQIESKDFRIGYGADQIIFSWEGNVDELRVDGGPARGQHKPGGGFVPAKTWFTIDLIVRNDSMTILVDGQPRHTISADFSKVSDRFTIRAHGSAAAIKSVQMTRPAE